MIRDNNYYAQALQARQDVSPGLLWAMMKSHFYLALGFVGATVTAIALRDVVMEQPSRLAPLELVLAAVVGIVVTVLAWQRASRVLQGAGDDVPLTSTKVLVKAQVPDLLGGYSSG